MQTGPIFLASSLGAYIVTAIPMTMEKLNVGCFVAGIPRGLREADQLQVIGDQ